MMHKENQLLLQFQLSGFEESLDATQETTDKLEGYLLNKIDTNYECTRIERDPVTGYVNKVEIDEV